MHTTKNSLRRRLLAMMMAVVMAMGLMPTAFAHEEGEEGDDHDHAHDTHTTYTITMADEERNQNGSILVKIDCPAEHKDQSTTDAIVDPTYNEETGKYTFTVHAGDQIVMRRQANTGYTVAELGYVRTGRESTTFAMKAATQDTNLKDTFGAGYIFGFTMPEYDVTLGAYFAHKTNDTYINNALSPDKNVIAGAVKFSPTEYLNIIMNDAWVYQNGTTVGVDAYVDQRLAEAFKTDSNYTMHLEARAVNDETSGYRVVAKLEKPLNEWLQLFEAAETKTDDSGRVIYILDDLLIPMLEDADLSLSDELYCTLQIGHKDWTNTFGAPSYRWTYSGGDHAYILPDGADMPEPMVWVHNLHPDTFFGERVLDAVAMINEEWDMDITVHYVTPEVMDEPIGALAGWPGYELSNNGSSDVEIAGRYLIYCNMPSIVRESLGDYISRACRGEVTTAKLTKTGAADTFEHMYGHLDEESELFSAAYRLSLASYNASKDVTRENAGEDHHWTEETWAKFDELIAKSKVLVAAPEGEYEAIAYRELATELMEMHMDFNGDTLINFDFRFRVEEYDAENYKVTVYASDVDMADLNIDYYWSYFDKPSQDYQIVKKDELYRVMCTISSKITKPGNFQTLYMSNPENPEYTISQTTNSISVTFAEYDYSREDMTQSYTLYNIPEVKHFAAALLDASGTVIAELDAEEADTLTFTGLKSGTEYTLRIHTANEVGRSDILTEVVSTDKKHSSGTTVKPPVTQPETPETPEVPEEPSVSPTFTDVAADTWYTADVAYVAEQGLMTGTSDTTFSPNSTTTRAMLMTILARLAGEDTSGDDSWYEKGMTWAMENGISDGTNPNGTITREQLATMLWRYAGSPLANGDLNAFLDGPQVSDYAVNALIWAVENGILNGNPDGSLNPQGSATRAQMAAMLHRFCENIL